jgi:hypothetical protein
VTERRLGQVKGGTGVVPRSCAQWRCLPSAGPCLAAPAWRLCAQQEAGRTDEAMNLWRGNEIGQIEMRG